MAHTHCLVKETVEETRNERISDDVTLDAPSLFLPHSRSFHIFSLCPLFVSPIPPSGWRPLSIFCLPEAREARPPHLHTHKHACTHSHHPSGLRKHTGRVDFEDSHPPS